MPSRTVMDRLDALASEQYGLVTYHQLLMLGVSPDTITRWIAGGRLEPRHPEVFRLAGSPPSWEQEVMAACLSIPGSLASHRTAAALRRLDGFPPGPIEVVVERWKRRHRSAAFIVRESKDLRPVDADVVRGIPCTSLVRTLVDLPAVVSEFRSRLAIDHAARNNPAILERVRDRHLEVARRGRTGTRVLRQILLDRLDGGPLPGSGFEETTYRLLVDAGLPTPERQVEVVDGDFRAYIDIGWPEVKVGIECDSLAHHFGEHALERDRQRRRRLTQLGWLLLEYGYWEVHRNGFVVVRETTDALRRRGLLPAIPA